MKQVVRYFIILFLCTLLVLVCERVVASSFLPGYLVPQLLSMLMVYISFHESGQRGLLSAFLIGLIGDFASAILLGPLAIAGIFVFLIIHILRQHVFAASGMVAAFAVFFSSMLVQIIAGVVRFSFVDLPWLFGGEMLVQALVSAILAPLVFSLFRAAFREHTERR